MMVMAVTECNQNDLLEDVTEFIQLLRELDDEQKRELRGMIRGMHTMKEILKERPSIS